MIDQSGTVAQKIEKSIFQNAVGGGDLKQDFQLRNYQSYNPYKPPRLVDHLFSVFITSGRFEFFIGLIFKGILFVLDKKQKRPLISLIHLFSFHRPTSHYISFKTR